MRVLDKLQEELVEICFNVDTLEFWINILIDEHEVRVHLKSTIFSQNYTNLVPLARLFISL